jgi:hypothetical protein
VAAVGLTRPTAVQPVEWGGVLVPVDAAGSKQCMSDTRSCPELPVPPKPAAADYRGVRMLIGWPLAS